MKTIRIISVAVAAAMLMACAKENIITPSSQELSSLTFNAVAAGSASGDATKTVLSGNGLDVLTPSPCAEPLPRSLPISLRVQVLRHHFQAKLWQPMCTMLYIRILQ